MQARNQSSQGTACIESFFTQRKKAGMHWTFHIMPSCKLKFGAERADPLAAFIDIRGQIPSPM
jgi:hypothetical protein